MNQTMLRVRDPAADEGTMRDIALVTDPDGDGIEILSPASMTARVVAAG